MFVTLTQLWKNWDYTLATPEFRHVTYRETAIFGRAGVDPERRANDFSTERVCDKGPGKEPGTDLETEDSDTATECAEELVEEIRPGDGSERPVHGVCQGATRRSWH